MSKKILMVFGGIVIGMAVLALAACGGPGRTAERITLDISSPDRRATAVTEPVIEVRGTVSNPAATVTIDEEPVSVASDGAFAREVALEYGSNRIRVVAEAEGARSATRTLTVPRNLVLTVDTPVDNSVVSDDRITVSGNISDVAAIIEIAGHRVQVGEDGAFSRELGLHYPLNVINVTATLDGVEPIVQFVTVRSDAESIAAASN